MDVQMGEGHDAAHPRKRSGWRGEADPLFAGVSEPIWGRWEPSLKDGPIPRFLHGFIEYAAGVLHRRALLSFESGAAVAVAILAGIAVLFLAAATEVARPASSTTCPWRRTVLDYVLAGLPIAMPFIAGFLDETAPTAFIALGVLHLLVTIGTRSASATSRADGAAAATRPRARATHPRARPASHPRRSRLWSLRYRRSAPPSAPPRLA